MTDTREPGTRPPVPPLAELFTRYLEGQTEARAQGLHFEEPAGGVVPHDAVPAQPVDPRPAWDEALAVLRYFPGAGSESRWTVPPDWPTLVASHEPVVALAFCLGNFPPLVRDLQPFLHGDDLAQRWPTSGRTLSAPALVEWAGRARKFPEALLAAAALRLAHHFDLAADCLARATDLPAPWQAVYANEEAALLWHRGETKRAAALWKAQDESLPVLFNRGMAALFLGHPATARTFLNQAVTQLPDTSAWHHLGRLYLTLAETGR